MNFFWATLMFLSGAVSVESQIYVSSKAERLLVFGDQKQLIPLTLTNTGVAGKANIDFRIFQLGGTVAAPIDERRFWKTVEIGHGQLLLDNLLVDLPSVKAQSGFVIRFYEGSRAAGSLALEAFPTNLLSALAASHETVIFDEANRFPGLEGFRLKNLSEPILADKPVLLISSMTIDQGTLSDLASTVDAIVHVATTRPADVDRLPIEGFQKGKAFVVSVDSRLLDNFPRSAEAQLNLIRAIKFALRRGSVARMQE